MLAALASNPDPDIGPEFRHAVIDGLAGSVIARAGRRSSGSRDRTPPPRPSRGRSRPWRPSTPRPAHGRRSPGLPGPPTRAVPRPRRSGGRAARGSFRGGRRPWRRPWRARRCRRTSPRWPSAPPRSTGRENPTLIDALGRAGSLQDAPGPLTPEQTAALAARALRQGDPARGEAVFRRKETLCLKCHAIAGAGGQVGPSLESVGASARSITWSTRCSSRTRRSRRATTRSPSR